MNEALAIDSVTLKRQLRRSQRVTEFKAAALVLPLFLFLLLTFLAPIGAMLWRAVGDADVAPVLPRTLAALKTWDGTELPPEETFAALVADMRAAREAGTLASAATRLNYDINGYRSLMFFHRASPAAGGHARPRGSDRQRCQMGRARDLGRDQARRRPAHGFLSAGRARSAPRRHRRCRVRPRQ